MIATTEGSNSLLGQAISYFEAGRYRDAQELFTEAGLQAAVSDSRNLVAMADAYLARIATEFLQPDKFAEIETELLQNLGGRGLDERVRSFVYYSLGVCCYRAFHHDFAKAQQYFGASLAAAVGRPADRAYALYGLLATSQAKGEASAAENFSSELADILAEVSVPEIDASFKIFRAQQLIQAGQTDEAEALVWRSLADLTRRPFHILNIHAHLALAQLHLQKEDRKTAHKFAEVALHSTSVEEMPRTHAFVKQFILGFAPVECDLRLVVQQSLAILGTGKVVNLSRQPVLRDFLHVLMQSHGRRVSKEALIKAVWGEAYDPTVHDNKIYVTVRRLRLLLQDHDLNLILRERDGYCLNPALVLEIVG